MHLMFKGPGEIVYSISTHEVASMIITYPIPEKITLCSMFNPNSRLRGGAPTDACIKIGYLKDTIKPQPTECDLYLGFKYQGYQLVFTKPNTVDILFEIDVDTIKDFLTERAYELMMGTIESIYQSCTTLNISDRFQSMVDDNIYKYN